MTSADRDPARYGQAWASVPRLALSGLPGRAAPSPDAAGERRRRTALSLALPAADIAGLAVAIAVSGAAARTGPGLLDALVYAVTVLVVAQALRLHRLRICLRVSDQAGRLAIAAGAPALMLAGAEPAGHARGAIWLGAWSAGLIFAARESVCAALRAVRKRGRLTEQALVVGSGTFGAYVAELLGAHPELGVRPVGFLDEGPARRDLALPTVGHPSDLAAVVRRLGISRVIVTFSTGCRDEEMVTLLRATLPSRTDVCIVPRLYELGMAVPRGCLDEIWGIPLIPLRRSGAAAAALAAKRAFDITAASVLLLLTAPLLAVFALAIRLRTRQAPVYRQSRVTKDGQVVSIVKLRTVRHHDDHDTRWTAAAEHTGTLGRWMRACHVDELPQLLNVIRGEMSLTGPRPERPYFAERFSRDIPRYDGRTRMPAGMTGWAQVNGLNGDTSIFERARFDNYYIEYWSVWLDIVILVRTVTAVFRGGVGVRT
jgi:exopolysaccharide biosynthesis polyprenyl glycosylphosphotransferase